MEQYKDFAFVYDELMNEVDYNGWVKYIEDIIKNENAQVQNILELACGTGNLTIPLTKKNYDIAGIDISEEMLSVAREKAEKENKDESQQMLSWFQIIMLIGRPLWDKTRKKWRILNGYQSVLGNTNNLFYEVTFTDTPYWENYADKQLYLSVPVEKEKQKESGDKGSNNKDK